jgi:WD40 repeat protein
MPGKMARPDPRPSVRITRGAGSGQHLASVLQEGRENANIDAGLGFIWRISAKEGTGEPVVLSHSRDWTGVWSLAMLADGRLASGGKDGNIKLWPMEGTGVPVVLSHGSEVLSLAVLADGRLASGSGDGNIKSGLSTKKNWSPPSLFAPAVIFRRTSGPVTWILILPGNPAVATSPRTGGHRIRNPRQVPDGRHLHQP